jgi:hypothetical protein
MIIVTEWASNEEQIVSAVLNDSNMSDERFLP